MGGFSHREKSLEGKFQHGKLLEFKMISRRNRLLGLWAAGKMGLVRDDAESYAREIVSLNLARPGIETVMRRISQDFSQKGLLISEHQLKKQLIYCEQDAGDQILNE